MFTERFSNQIGRDAAMLIKTFVVMSQTFCKVEKKLTFVDNFRDNRKSTESSNSSDTDDSNPLNLKTSGKRGGKHLGSSKRRKV